MANGPAENLNLEKEISDHLNEAVRGDMCNCVVAQALQDQFGETIEGGSGQWAGTTYQ